MATAQDASPVIVSELDGHILKAIRDNDVGTIERLLRTKEMDVNHMISETYMEPDGLSHTVHYPVIVKAIVGLRVDIVSRIIDIAAELGQTLELSEALQSIFCIYFGNLYPTSFWSEPDGIDTLYDEGNRPSECKEIIQLLFHVWDQREFDDRINIAFTNGKFSNCFVAACEYGVDDFVMKCLDFIVEPRCCIDWFWDTDKALNVFHYFDRLAKNETRMAMIDRIPFTRILANSEGNLTGQWVKDVPLLHIMKMSGGEGAINAAKILIESRTVDPDLLMNGEPVLSHVTLTRYMSVETLLRCGCSIDVYNKNGFSPLSKAAFRSSKARTPHDKKAMARFIEYFLSFSVSLQHELYLYDWDELPNEFQGDQDAKRRSARLGIKPNLLEKLKELRRSNEMLSLKWMCRKAIRQRLKPRADDVIEKLDTTSIPESLKEYLKLVDEPYVLFHPNGELIE